jgi:hypothetical protein
LAEGATFPGENVASSALDYSEPGSAHPFGGACSLTGRYQPDLLREIFGPLPFRDIPSPPEWRSANVIGLASTIYEERAYEHLPILADALMDAGCFDEDILDHCRNPGQHVRGCWALDLVLGKA